MWGAPLLCLLVLPGCASRAGKLLEEPELTPVASEWRQGTAYVQPAKSADEDEAPEWIGGPADYFRDARAFEPGDLLTVVIDINDKASFNSSANASRTSAADADAGFNMGLLGIVGVGQGEASAGANTSTSGQGAISRSEKLSVSVAAIVRERLPNGNFYIEGYQEVMVNNELRKLRVAGLVDPRNITPDNTIAYDKIAQARISYGSEGTIAETGRKGWGLQLWDKFRPF